MTSNNVSMQGFFGEQSTMNEYGRPRVCDRFTASNVVNDGVSGEHGDVHVGGQQNYNAGRSALIGDRHTLYNTDTSCMLSKTTNETNAHVPDPAQMVMIGVANNGHAATEIHENGSTFSDNTCTYSELKLAEAKAKEAVAKLRLIQTQRQDELKAKQENMKRQIQLNAAQYEQDCASLEVSVLHIELNNIVPTSQTLPTGGHTTTYDMLGQAYDANLQHANSYENATDDPIIVKNKYSDVHKLEHSAEHLISTEYQQMNPAPGNVSSQPQYLSMSVQKQDGCIENAFNVNRAFSELASVMKQGFAMPKAEMLTFDGSPTQFPRFIHNFDCIIGCNTGIDDSLKLNYLIQYCTGNAKECIEDCVILNSGGYMAAREILKNRYGQPHSIARSFILELINGPAIVESDVEGLLQLATKMKKCELTLSSMGYLADINNTDNILKIARRLPMELRKQWTETAGEIIDCGREPNFSELHKFVDKASRISNTVYGRDLMTACVPPQPRIQKNEANVKLCYICNLPDHLAKDCDQNVFRRASMSIGPYWAHGNRDAFVNGGENMFVRSMRQEHDDNRQSQYKSVDNQYNVCGVSNEQAGTNGHTQYSNVDIRQEPNLTHRPTQDDTGNREIRMNRDRNGACVPEPCIYEREFQDIRMNQDRNGASVPAPCIIYGRESQDMRINRDRNGASVPAQYRCGTQDVRVIQEQRADINGASMPTQENLTYINGGNGVVESAYESHRVQRGEYNGRSNGASMNDNSKFVTYYCAYDTGDVTYSEVSDDNRVDMGDPAGKTSKICLRVLPVLVQNKVDGTCTETYALLDDCSDVSLCTQSLVRKLGLSGEKQSYNLTAVTRRSDAVTGTNVAFDVISLDKTETINVENVIAVENLHVSQRSIPTNRDLKRWPHLADLSIPEIESTEIEILIGSNVTELFWTLEERRGGKKEPYATRSLLGWSVVGPVNRIGSKVGSQNNEGLTDNDLPTTPGSFKSNKFPILYRGISHKGKHRSGVKKRVVKSNISSRDEGRKDVCEENCVRGTTFSHPKVTGEIVFQRRKIRDLTLKVNWYRLMVLLYVVYSIHGYRSGATVDIGRCGNTPFHDDNQNVSPIYDKYCDYQVHNSTARYLDEFDGFCIETYSFVHHAMLSIVERVYVLQWLLERVLLLCARVIYETKYVDVTGVVSRCQIRGNYEIGGMMQDGCENGIFIYREAFHRGKVRSFRTSEVCEDIQDIIATDIVTLPSNCIPHTRFLTVMLNMCIDTTREFNEYYNLVTVSWITYNCIMNIGELISLAAILIGARMLWSIS